MKKIGKERRRFQRHDTEMKVSFQVSYDIKTRVKFQVLDKSKQKLASKKYSGLSKNINVEGLCFTSKKKLEKGNKLLLEVYAPNIVVPVRMQGKVLWDIEFPQGSGLFHAGVKLISVNKKPVADTIHYDKKYKVIWSIVLESVFGSFKTMVKKIKEHKGIIKEI
ncbi:MAG: PilZ domain-containing protein [Candidatus Omnitrophota bacterium]